MAKLIQVIQENVFFIALLGLMGLGFIFLRTEPTDLGSWEELERILHDGQPAIVEFYSNT